MADQSKTPIKRGLAPDQTGPVGYEALEPKEKLDFLRAAQMYICASNNLRSKFEDIGCKVGDYKSYASLDSRWSFLSVLWESVTTRKGGLNPPSYVTVLTPTQTKEFSKAEKRAEQELEMLKEQTKVDEIHDQMHSKLSELKAYVAEHSASSGGRVLTSKIQNELEGLIARSEEFTAARKRVKLSK